MVVEFVLAMAMTGLGTATLLLLVHTSAPPSWWCYIVGHDWSPRFFDPGDAPSVGSRCHRCHAERVTRIE